MYFHLRLLTVIIWECSMNQGVESQFPQFEIQLPHHYQVPQPLFQFELPILHLPFGLPAPVQHAVDQLPHIPSLYIPGQVKPEDSAETKLLNEQGLASHNQYRAQHKAPALVLDKDLIRDAQAWATKLAADSDQQQKIVMTHHDGKDHGENIFGAKVSYEVNGTQPVDSWYDEVKLHDFDNNQFNPASGHFSQMIWADTRRVGMAKAKSPKGYVIVVARYKPPGNSAYKEEFAKNVFPKQNSNSNSSSSSSPA